MKNWKKLLVCMIMLPHLSSLNAQVKEVSGTVIDNETGDPLTGATIRQEGTSNGVVSDIEGNFTLSLEDTPARAEIVISFIGYLTKRINVENLSRVEVFMETDIQSLSEIVVIGYGSQKKEDVTGAVSALTSDQLELQPLPRMENMLQGRLAGVQTTQNSGAPGAAINIRIRGASSFGAGNNPLFVIDGIIGGDINTINPNDIASISVLKDASANAIYGAFAANGVVVITTKKGQAGKPRLDIDYTNGTSMLSKKHDLMNAVDYMIAVQDKQIVTDDGIAPGDVNNPRLFFTDNDIRAALVDGESTDWQDEIFQTATAHNLQATLSGGNDNSTYYLSIGGNSTGGILLNTKYQRLNFRFKYDLDISEKLSLTLNLNNDYDVLTNVNRNSGSSRAVATAIGYAPTEQVFLEDGTYSLRTVGYGYQTRDNPVFRLEAADRKNRTNNLQGIFGLEYQVTNDLSLETKIIPRLINNFNTNVTVATPDDVATSLTPNMNNTSGVTKSQRFYFQNSNQLNFKKKIQDHFFDAFVGYEFFTWEQPAFTQSAQNFDRLDLDFFSSNIAPTATDQASGAAFSNESWVSYLGRFNYAFKEQYLLTFTYRNDGSSRLKEGKEWEDFFSGSFGYRLPLSLLYKTSWLDDGKIRIGYGQAGQRAVGIFATQATLGPNANAIQRNPGNAFYSWETDGSTRIYYFVVNNSNVGWETVTTTNVGIDLSFLEGRISFTGDAYIKRSTDLIFPVPTPGYFGGGTVDQNIGEMENRGIELLLDVISVDNPGGLRLLHTLTFTKNTNELLKTSPLVADTLLSGTNDPQTFGSSHWNIIGQELGLYRGVTWEGTIYQQGDDIPAGRNPGDLVYRDVDGNGVINEFDAVTIGSSVPDFTFGFVTDASYKNFSFSMTLEGVYGRDVYNWGKYNLLGGGGGILNGTSTEVLDRWTPGNTNTHIPGFTQTSLFIKNSTYFIEDASFVRCRNASFSYDLHGDYLERLGLRKCRFTASVQNAFVITGYSGYDPESFNSTGARNTGIDEGSFPTPRTFTFGINVGL